MLLGYYNHLTDKVIQEPETVEAVVMDLAEDEVLVKDARGIRTAGL